MALDGAFLCRLRQELEAHLIGTRVDKIHQPSREELVLFLRSKTGNFKLYLSARAASARACLAETTPENPPSPPMFCMLLRKRLSGGRLTAIRQPGLERVLWFDFDCVNELGDIVSLTLAAEMMGRNSNLILIDETGRVVDAVKRVDIEMSPVRPVLPGVRYEEPPRRAGKWDISAYTAEEFVTILQREGRGELSEALLACSMGLSPLLCREIAFRVGGEEELMVETLSEVQKQRLIATLEMVQNASLKGEKSEPWLLLNEEGTPLAFSFVPLLQYGLQARGEAVSSFSALLERFFTEKDQAERMRQRAHDTRRVVTTARERIARKLAHQKEEQSRSVNREELRMQADLINANLGLIPKGASEAQLINYYDPNCATITVKLDPSLSAAANARKYYKEYRKAQRAETILLEQIAQGEQELNYLDSVMDALSRAESVREIGELRQELAQSGYVRLQATKQKPPAPLGPLAFLSDDGYTILVGRNNVQNDLLTLKKARGSDMWFHTKNVPGSHVIVFTEGTVPPDRTLEQAAMLAAYHSKAADSAQVPVDYTMVKNVKKPTGAKPGKVIYETYSTAYVTPDKLLVNRLRKENAAF